MDKGKGKVLVTGGVGFIGSHIVDLLIVQVGKVVIDDHLQEKEDINPSSFYKMNIGDLFKVLITKGLIMSAIKLHKPVFLIRAHPQLDAQRILWGC